jgi:tetratricopeptide (TPR) repeat protein
MSGLSFFLLGSPRVELDDAPVEIRRRRALALLCYLAVSGQAHSRDALATLFYPEQPQSRARAYLRRDLAILNSGLDEDWLEALGSSWYVGSTLNYFGSAYRLHGDYEQAERLFYQSLEAAKAVGHRRYMALALSNLGCLAYDRAEYYQAEQFQQEALAIWRELDHQPELASVLRYLGQIAAAAGEPRQPEASDYFRQALKLALQHRLAPVALDVLLGLAGLLAARVQSPRAVELASLVEQHPASSHQTRVEARQQLSELTAMLPADEFAAAKFRSQSQDWRTVAENLIEEDDTREASASPALG